MKRYSTAEARKGSCFHEHVLRGKPRARRAALQLLQPVLLTQARVPPRHAKNIHPIKEKP